MNIFAVIINYNGSDDTVECVKSILKMKNYGSIRIIVLDNNSNTKEKIKLQVLKRINNIVLLELKMNLGFGIANNIGVKYAIDHGADYLLIVNNDTIVSDNLITEMMPYANNNTIIVPNIYYFNNPDKLWYAGGKLSKWKGTSVHWYKEKSNKDVQVVNFATGCCFFVHKDIIKKYGLFDENYFMYYEDTDFSIKMLLNDIKILHVPLAKIWHKVGQSSNKISGLQEYYINRNRLFLIKKYKTYFNPFFCYTYFCFTRIIMILLCIKKGNSIKYIIKSIVDFKKNKMGEQKIC